MSSKAPPSHEHVALLVDRNDVAGAAALARSLPPNPAAYWRVASQQLAWRRFDRASRVVEELGLAPARAGDAGTADLEAFVVRLVDDAQFALAMKWLPRSARRGRRPAARGKH